MIEVRKFAELRSVESGETLAQVFVPNRSDDALSTCLRMLTHQLRLHIGGNDFPGGLFGGPYGYGVHFENDVFEMHPDYQGDCTCGYIDDDGHANKAMSGGHTPDCLTGRNCFHHKASGLVVNWYKYIGRDNDVKLGTPISLHDVFTDCLRSIGGMSLDGAFAAYEKAEEDDAEDQRKFFEAMNTPEGRAAMDELMRSCTVTVVEPK